jgi:hypothetical protein
MEKYSIVITTFEERFDAYLKPLLLQIKKVNRDIEIIVTVNGPYNREFEEIYRRDVLMFMSGIPKCFPIIFTNFQSLAKMWNRGILNSTCNKVLVLNDDLILGNSFFSNLESVLMDKKETFQINGSFSHFVINKLDLIAVGFFDERLLGLGEEDGDFYWRYQQHFRKVIASIDIPDIENVHSDIRDMGYTKGIRTASKFNRDFIKQKKYRDVLIGGYKGMFDHKVTKIIPDATQYPYEEFYLLKKHEL